MALFLRGLCTNDDPYALAGKPSPARVVDSAARTSAEGPRDDLPVRRESKSDTGG